jgi:hypothetical protein
MNIDPGNHPPPLGGFGMDKITGFRWVCRREYSAQMDAYADAGYRIMSVVTEQSRGYVYPRSKIVQVENEPDLNDVPALVYAAYWNLYRDTYNGAGWQWCSAGLGRGLINAGDYLAQVWPHMHRKPDMIGVHCYDKDVAQAAAEMDDLWNRFGKPIVCTEWNHTNDQVWGMLAMLNGADGRSSWWNSYFPYCTAMDPSVQGLVDENDHPTEYGASWVSSPDV